jgi:hypothetical protein
VLGVAGPDNDEWLRSLGVEPVNRGDDLGDRHTRGKIVLIWSPSA